MARAGMARMTKSENLDHEFVETIHATEGCVRKFLQKLPNDLNTLGVEEPHWSRIELVMAEALNNIVEHAYSGVEVGDVVIEASNDSEQLFVNMRDMGHPMPGLSLPAGDCPPNEGPLDSLPEGGFGWFLIKSLTENLEYQRSSGENHLTFCIPLQKH